MAATKTTRSTKARRDVEAEITERVITALEAGTAPWQQPWTASGVLPTSVSTGRPYRGINVVLLSMTAQAEGYASPYWLTFNQAKERGGTVRKGEHGTLVVFWKLLDVERDNADGGKDKVKVPVLRHYTVFNLEQCDDVTLPPRFDLDEREAIDPTEAVASILDSYTDGPQVRHAAQDAAYYNPGTDVVTLPALNQYDSVDDYASVLFHELTHSTGHSSRLDRFERTGEPSHFGSERYAFEELLAQMGSAMLAAHAGIDPQVDNSAAYIASWLRRLRDDKSLVIRAAQGAQKAVDRVVGTTFERGE